MLPVDILTLPLLSAQSSSLAPQFHAQARPGLQTKTHSIPQPFPQPQHRKRRETGDSEDSAKVGFGLTSFLCPKTRNILTGPIWA